jgi:pimeloyl-ACP methyl ester carboxylesterase
MMPHAESTPAGTSYRVVGLGRPVVLIHGVGLNKEMWGGQVVGLAEHFQVIVYDMLGHGESPRPTVDVGLADYARQLHELLEHLDVPQAVVVGFSMGGLVARAFALHYAQQTTALVVLNSVFERSPEQRDGVLARASQAAQYGPGANAEAALSRWFSPEYRAANPAQMEAIRQTLARNDAQGYLIAYRLFASQDMFGAEALGSIRVPVLVATGELDSGSTPQMAVQLAQRIDGARAVVLVEQRHMMPVESPRLVNRMLLQFLGEFTPLPNSAKGRVA